MVILITMQQENRTLFVRIARRFRNVAPGAAIRDGAYI